MDAKRKKEKPQAKVLSTYQLMHMFPNEQAALDYLKPIIWPNGPVCPHCKSRDIATRSKDNQYNCRECRKDFTIRVGNIFHRSHVPLHKWLYAMYLLVTSRKGISSLQLSKEIGVTQKTAWFLLQRIRAACGNQTKKLLSGIIEVDETYIGGVEANKHASRKLHTGRGPVNKIPIFGMRDRKGQVVAKAVKSTDKATLQGAILDTSQLGSTVCTDEHGSYTGLDVVFNHKQVCHSAKQFVNGMAHTNGIESVWAVLKRGYFGTYHSFSEKHIPLYVDEFVFRLNEGNCAIDTIDRLKALAMGARGRRVTYRMLTEGRCAIE